MDNKHGKRSSANSCYSRYSSWLLVTTTKQVVRFLTLKTLSIFSGSRVTPKGIIIR